MQILSVIGPFILICFLLIVLAFLIRAFGSWMLRIDEVIENQKVQTKFLKRISEDIQNKMYSNDEKLNTETLKNKGAENKTVKNENDIATIAEIKEIYENLKSNK